MRTPSLLVLALAGLLATAASATATHDETREVNELVDETLGDMGLPAGPGLPDSELGKGDGSSGDSSGTGGFAASVVAAAVYVGQVAEAAGENLLHIGLGLVAQVFGLFATGGDTAASAVHTVVDAPSRSAGIATLVAVAVGGGLGLLGLVQRYGSLAAVPLFSRIAKSELLENKVRAEIFELIQTNPGINVSEVARRLDIAWGTATHHLQKLRAERLIAIRRVANQKCYFQNGGSYTPSEMDVMSATKNPTAKSIAVLLVEGGPHCHQDISRELGISPALVSFHMRKLLDAGIVEKERRGRRTIFSAMTATLDPAPRAAVAH